MFSKIQPRIKPFLHLRFEPHQTKVDQAESCVSGRTIVKSMISAT